MEQKGTIPSHRSEWGILSSLSYPPPQAGESVLICITLALIIHRIWLRPCAKPSCFLSKEPTWPQPLLFPLPDVWKRESGGQIPSNQRCVWIFYWLWKRLAVTLHASQRDKGICNLTEGWGHTFCSSFTISSPKQARGFTERECLRQRERQGERKRERQRDVVWNVAVLHLNRNQTERHHPPSLQQTPL